MNFTLFSDLIDALGKVAQGIFAIVNLPKGERQHYRQTMDEIYRLIDTTLNMVIMRLGDILLLENSQQFLDETRRLGNYSDWLRSERELRLCKSLRITLCEAETLQGNLSGKLSTTDGDALVEQMRAILAKEEAVAAYIGDCFQALAEFASNADMDTVRQQVVSFKGALCQEREQLIQQEISLYSIV